MHSKAFGHASFCTYWDAVHIPYPQLNESACYHLLGCNSFLFGSTRHHLKLISSPLQPLISCLCLYCCILPPTSLTFLRLQKPLTIHMHLTFCRIWNRRAALHLLYGCLHASRIKLPSVGCQADSGFLILAERVSSHFVSCQLSS
jgi:hypothetical protein